MTTGARHTGGAGSRGTIQQGKATKPLRLPAKAPKCFRNQAQWVEYVKCVKASAGDGFTFCSDCTPEHKAAMIKQGRCAWPGTQFRLMSGIIIGRRKK